jgi:hypothetical protein
MFFNLSGRAAQTHNSTQLNSNSKLKTPLKLKTQFLQTQNLIPDGPNSTQTQNYIFANSKLSSKLQTQFANSKLSFSNSKPKFRNSISLTPKATIAIIIVQIDRSRRSTASGVV